MRDRTPVVDSNGNADTYGDEHTNSYSSAHQHADPAANGNGYPNGVAECYANNDSTDGTTNRDAPSNGSGDTNGYDPSHGRTAKDHRLGAVVAGDHEVTNR